MLSLRQATAPRTNKNRGRKSFGLERLEERSMMAGLSATLSSTGQLTITGTSGADTITVHNLNNKITIDSVTSSFDATKVKSLNIITGGGADKITLDNGKNSGEFGIGVTINGGVGNQTAQLVNGAQFYFGGSNTTVSIDKNGAKINGAATTWFDANVQDAALRALGNADLADGKIDRNEMIGLLRQAEKNGTVTASLLADLKSIVTTTSLFGGNSYVQTLATDVVVGNVANAKFQGKALGNLAVGSSATQLENLVQKWFLGADVPVGKSDWGPTYGYAQANGQLFVNGASATDIKQGGIGDCYFLAGLSETALKNPSAITSMFIVNGDGTYGVRFFNNGKADYVTVNSQLPVDQYGRFVFAGMGNYASSTSNELWVGLAEKAYAQMNELGWLRPKSMGGGVNSYAGISGGYIEQALSQVTGQAATAAVLTNTDAGFTAFAAAFNAGKSIGLSSLSTPANKQVVGGHAYAVIGVDTVNKTVTVYNPWGNNNGTQYPGTMTIKWSDLNKSFGWLSRTV